MFSFLLQVANMTKSVVQKRSAADDEDIDPTVYIIPLLITFIYELCAYTLYMSNLSS